MGLLTTRYLLCAANTRALPHLVFATRHSPADAALPIPRFYKEASAAFHGCRRGPRGAGWIHKGKAGKPLVDDFHRKGRAVQRVSAPHPPCLRGSLLLARPAWPRTETPVWCFGASCCTQFASHSHLATKDIGDKYSIRTYTLHYSSDESVLHTTVFSD